MNVLRVVQRDQDVDVEQRAHQGRRFGREPAVARTEPPNSGAFLVTQPLDGVVADTAAARRKRFNTERLQALRRFSSARCGTARRGQRAARQAADDGADRLLFTPRRFLGSNQDVVVNVESGSHGRCARGRQRAF